MNVQHFLQKVRCVDLLDPRTRRFGMTAHKTGLPDGVPRRTLFCKLTTFLTLVRQRWIWGFSPASLPSHQQISVLDMLNKDFAQMNPISTNHKVLVDPIQPCDIIWTLGVCFLAW